ncbi:hypothetical protein Ate02nite_44850 [Paractinoplanes tereljensis]|uniref:Uncharacterized protein n=1 Tax=Paractinoplanes tereljensis TaxID=571912 RepID=A0A919TUV5_9ACTN|nr:hypothetical protein Ate02nite_44850 [Actinoplanes tereljensis]
MVDAEFDGSLQDLDGVGGVAVFQLHGAEADPEDVVFAELPVRGHGVGPPDTIPLDFVRG